MNFKQLFKIDKSKLTFAGYMFLAGAIAFSWIQLSQPKIKSVKDLYFIKGHFRDYDFQDYARSVSYTFRLVEYSNSFKIKADFLGGNFKIDEFKNLTSGSNLTIAIAKDDIQNLNTNKSYFFVFAVANATTIFLDPSFTIKKHNSNFIYYDSAVFVMLGLLSIYYGRKANKIKVTIDK